MEGSSPKSRRFDFFVSYSHKDETWARWVKGLLELAGFKIKCQADDFKAGNDFLIKMQDAVEACDKIIPIITPSYFTSEFAMLELMSFLYKDPIGKNNQIIPVIVQPCDHLGLISSRIHINISYLAEKAAAAKILETLGISELRRDTLLKSKDFGTRWPGNGLREAKASEDGRGRSTQLLVLRIDADFHRFEDLPFREILSVLGNAAGQAKVSIERIEKGSIKLVIGTDSEGSLALLDLFRRGQLGEIAGSKVLSLDALREERESAPEPGTPRVSALIVGIGDIRSLFSLPSRGPRPIATMPMSRNYPTLCKLVKEEDGRYRFRKVDVPVTASVLPRKISRVDGKPISLWGLTLLFDVRRTQEDLKGFVVARAEPISQRWYANLPIRKRNRGGIQELLKPGLPLEEALRIHDAWDYDPWNTHKKYRTAGSVAAPAPEAGEIRIKTDPDYRLVFGLCENPEAVIESVSKEEWAVNFIEDLRARNEPEFQNQYLKIHGRDNRAGFMNPFRYLDFAKFESYIAATGNLYALLRRATNMAIAGPIETEENQPPAFEALIKRIFVDLLFQECQHLNKEPLGEARKKRDREKEIKKTQEEARTKTRIDSRKRGNPG